MTIFGTIYIVILIFAFFTNIKNLFVLTIFSAVLQCDNVFVIGNIGIGPQVITSFVFLIKVILIKKEKFLIINKKVLLIEISALLLMIISFISLIVNNKLGNEFLRYLQLVIYILCFIAMSRVSDLIDNKFVHKCIKYLSVFLIVIGFIQLMITTGILPRFTIIKELLYNDNISDVIYFTRDNYFRILSTYMEPSYYACYLVGAFYYFLLQNHKTKGEIALIFFIFIQIILTFSSTAYIAFALIGLVYFMLIKSWKKRLIMAFLAIAGLLILYFGFYDVLDSVILSKAESGSANARFANDAKAIRIFNENKVIGVGYKTTRASSAITTILAEMGIIGLSCYCILNLFIVKDIFQSEKKNIDKQELGIRVAILSVVVAQIIAVPDIDICAYWMWMNILAVVMLNKSQRSENNE